MRRGETLVIYLSGHGDREGGDWFFLRTISKGSRGYRGNSTVIKSDKILSAVTTAILDDHPVILIVDSCHAGQLRYSGGWHSLEYHLKSRPNAQFIMLASSIPNEVGLGK